MIDICNELYTLVATALRTNHDTIRISGEYVQVPASYPAVTFEEIDNTEIESDSSNRERYSRVRYRVQVFSNATGKRTEARGLLAEIDDTLRPLGFRRTSFSTTPDIYNADVYSITAIYSAVVDENDCVHGTY